MNKPSLVWSLWALCGLVQGCRHQPEPPTPWVGPAQPVPQLQWVATPLEVTATAANLVESLQLLGAGDDALAGLLESARQVPRARLGAEAPLRRWLMLAVYQGVQGRGLAERFDTVRGLVDALQAEAPNAPETMFCRAYLRHILLPDDGVRLQAGSLDRSIVSDLERDLGGLVSRHPQFAGPAPWTPERLQREHQRVVALLAAWPAGAPSDASPTAATGAAAAVTPASGAAP